MADYQRFVSYLYDYKNNIKTKNCGFCRVELRDHTCRLEVHLKLPLYPFTPTLKVYVFVPSNEKLYGIFLGNASYHQGNVSGTFSFSEKNIMNSSYHFSQLGGIIIQTDSDFCFASAWKDITIYPERFVLHENKSEKQKNLTKDFKPELSFPNSPSEITMDKQKIEPDQSDAAAPSAISAETEILPDSTIQGTSAPECTASQEEEIITPKSEISIEPKIPDEKEITNTSENVQESHSRKQTKEISEINNFSEDIPKSNLNNKTDNTQTSQKLNTIHTEGLHNTIEPSQTDSAKEINFNTEPEPALLAASMDSSPVVKESIPDNFWESILKSYPQCHPFFDDEIHNCVQLTPKDVHKISVSGYPIENNAFFRHNCQSFQHFLIGKKDCSLYNTGSDDSSTHTCQNREAGKTHYILAVPGIYNPKEQYMASMFGFPYFKCSQNSHYRNNCWGYWYRIIPEHWNHCKFKNL